MDPRAKVLAASRQTVYKACSMPGPAKTAAAREVMLMLARVSAGSPDVVGTIRATLLVNQALRAAPVPEDRWKTTTPSSTRPPHLALASSHPRRRA
jgi:hypothetical protein